MASAAVPNSSIHFAPTDPTLPPPWKALVDGSTGYIYYWNTETNTTQYEKPLPPQAPPPSGPPLPVGPPPGTTPTGPSESPSGGPLEMNSAMNSNPSDNSGANVLNPVVHPHIPGQGIHGMNNGVVHPGSMINSSQPTNQNFHPNPGVMGPGNMYGNFNSNPPGQPVGGHMAGSGPGGGHMMMGNHPGGGGHMVGGAPRSAPGIHMNAGDNAYGGGGRSVHSGGPVGGPPGVMGGNFAAAPIRNMQSGGGVNVPMQQPKLAVLLLPQRQQAMGGMHVPVQSRQANHLGNSAGPVSSGPGPFKRPANDFTNTEPELLKRPRMQGFPEPVQIMDVDAYRRQHEITVNGDNIPAPFMTFEGASFPPDLAREVRYLLQPGANVVRCAAATAESQHTAVILWGLHPCGLSARDIVPLMDYPVA